MLEPINTDFLKYTTIYYSQPVYKIYSWREVEYQGWNGIYKKV